MTLVPLRLATDGFFTSQSAGENTLNPATLDAIRDRVWTAALSQYQTIGTAGRKLSDTATPTNIPPGLTAQQVWEYTGGDRSLSGAQAVNSAVTLGLVQAFVQGRFRINYANGTATQYNPDGTVLQVFDLRDADGNDAFSAQTAVDRVPVSGGSVAPAGLFSLSDLADVNLNPVDGSVAVWNDGELTITSDVQRSNIIGGGNF